MSKFDFKKLREEIKHTNSVLKDMFKAVDSKLNAYNQRIGDLEHKERCKQGAKKAKLNPEYYIITKKAAQKRLERDDYNERYEKRKSSKKWQEIITNLNKNRPNDINWRKALLTKNAKPVILKDIGIFPTRVKAINHYSNIMNLTYKKSYQKIVYMMQYKSNENYYISQEEYKRLTGKEVWED